jgi:D-alanyl-D-alanine dipeptidase
LPASRQLVLVTAAEWDSPRGVLRRYERERGGTRWRQIGATRDVLLGERGMAWGLGLHEVPRDASRRKHEGDRRAPAGVFLLSSAFGRLAASQYDIARFPYRQLVAGTEAVDDPASRFYNHIVQREHVPAPDWKSSERMAEIADYELGVMVAHNPQNIPGAGSCIFIHQWRGERTGTAGCTALRAPHLLKLIRWLDADQHPVLVQLPGRELPAGFP